MKKLFIKIGAVFFLLALLGISCKKLDETRPFDKFDELAVWSSKNNAMVFVNGAYAEVLNLYTNYVEDEVRTNNIIASNGDAFTRDQITRDDDYGFNQFSRIRRCNLIIEKAQTSNLTEAEKTELVGHGKFLRAMTYYWLARRFGRVVYVDRLLTESEENFSLPQTASIAETYTLLMKDINDAIAGLPETAPSGLASKAAAYALKSEVALQAAAYTGEASYYQQSIDAADAIIGSGKHALQADYEGIFNEKQRFSSEVILGYYRDKSNTVVSSIDWDMQRAIPNVNNDDLNLRGGTPLFKQDKVFENWGRYSPTQNLMDDYLAIDQADPTKAVKWDQTSQYQANITKRSSTYADSAVITGQGSINSVIYNNRDKRLAASIVYDSTAWYGELVTTNRNGNLHRLIKGSLNSDCCTQITNAFFRKGIYSNIAPRPFFNVNTDYHWVIFRLGRVYLNKAEALLRQGKIPEAVQTFNITREFHGGLPASTAVSAADAWTDYKRERRVELFKEKDYYWSLLRWGKYGGDANHGIAANGTIPELEEAPTFMEINANRNGYRVEVINFNQNDIRVFDETRRYLLPIQNSQIVRHGSLEQNPNW
ncbi:RagB/SusD family nutrient uptake outer membrane protein [Flavihumibacter sp. CACIAM 22H1]|uniref:RagB/SusD family nutrient uptake outer membrane protein n=1 Tax=Flavihumibacter sp. CACIAM 22H1 TaxID=1812911 RepID=UPI0007A7E407|nr:RagB/SusD family nutrient uptake outer membrane protein [Flavihumibacter sp. CACIAM 22H1]KYP15364.1 MAG: hypothetical protein A1D16_16405 [Flavihumibacter sp. CACIAM 22H1]